MSPSAFQLPSVTARCCPPRRPSRHHRNPASPAVNRPACPVPVRQRVSDKFWVPGEDSGWKFCLQFLTSRLRFWEDSRNGHQYELLLLLCLGAAFRSSQRFLSQAESSGVATRFRPKDVKITSLLMGILRSFFEQK